MICPHCNGAGGEIIRSNTFDTPDFPDACDHCEGTGQIGLSAICAICTEPITGIFYDVRHSGNPDSPREFEEYHEECCPYCNPQQENT